VIAIGIGLAGVARAEPVEVPPGWDTKADRAWSSLFRHSHPKEYDARFIKIVHEPSQATVDVIIDRAAITVGRDTAARLVLEDRRTEPARMDAFGIDVETLGWSERVDPIAKQIEGVLFFRAPTSRLAGATRVIVVADATHMVAVSATCIYEEKTPTERSGECMFALGTLDPAIPPDRRVTVSLAPPMSLPPDGSGAPVPSLRLRTTFDDGSAIELPPVPVSTPERATDLRPVYVGFGIVVLAALFWWNQRKREKFEKEDSDER
jgi:hypothetical protein